MTYAATGSLVDPRRDTVWSRRRLNALNVEPVELPHRSKIDEKVADFFKTADERRDEFWACKEGSIINIVKAAF